MKKYLPMLLITIIASCASNPNKLENQVSAVGKPGNIEITDLTKSKDINNNINVRWNFTTKGDNPEQVFWRCDFYDANGFRVGEPAKYIEATIYPNQATEETCTYPSEAATDFKISFQNIKTNMTIYH